MSSSRPLGVGGRILGSLFFLVFFGMGLLFCVLIVEEVYRGAKTYSWPKAECVIIESGVQENGRSQQPYRFHVHYDYQWQGRTYAGAKWSRQEAAYSDYSDAQRLVSRYPADSRAECFVNPENPSEAMLKRPGLWIGLFIFVPLIFVGVGGAGVAAMWARTGNEVPPKRKTDLLSSSEGGEPQPISSVSTWAQILPTRAVTINLIRWRVGNKTPADPKDGLLPPALASSGREGELRLICSIRTSGGRKKAGAGLFAFFFLVGAVAFYFITFRPLQSVFAARNWAATPCMVVSSHVQSQRSDDGTTYRVDILYRYEFNGEEHRSSRYQFLGLSSSGYKGKAEIVRRHPPGTQQTCFVNPSDPTEAVLERGLTADMWFGAIPAVFMLMGAGGMIGAWRGRQASERSRFGAADPEPMPAREIIGGD